ncbi:MAG: hypothetical protein ACI94Y_002130 [Maribacter sp.]|jgi:hypothetical protein
MNHLPKWYSWLISLVLGIAVSLRLVVYFQNRALFLDEANVCMDIISKDYFGLFQIYESGQQMPPFVAIFIKSFSLALGNNEYTLRLFSLIIGLSSVYLFFILSKKFIKTIFGLLFTNWIFATSYLLIQYATEAKQYGTDVFITMLLILLATRNPEKEFSTKNMIGWMTLGAVAVWFCMPSIFVLAGVGFYWLLHQKNLIKHQPQKVLPIIIIGSSWLINFGLYYYILLSPALSQDSLVSYHEPYFLPIFPTDLASLDKWTSIQFEILRSTIGKTGIAVAAGIILFLSGWYFCFKDNWKKGILLLAPILLAWLASGLDKYSLIPRLALFYLPISLLIMGYAIDGIYQWGKSYIRWILGILLILVASHQDGFDMFWKPLTIDEIKPILEHISENANKNDLIYIHFEGIAAFEFYTKYHDDKDSRFNLSENPAIYTRWDTKHPALIQPYPKRVWLLFAHTEEKPKAKMTQKFLLLYDKKEQIESVRASCILLEKK